MFEKASEYPVVCRYSSEPGDPGLDVSHNALISLDAAHSDLRRTVYHNRAALP